ncbi:hypothetical protein P376_3579 [Streptomyces sp. HCCB10043]|uniref:Predicted protein n=1 Tax=Streptomyces filamentosus NRRL 15998 TaxID=457431 RepID=D6AJ40_STRFL|nr:predicted protein [Streptomyces filamentosus NRRL 15998]ESU48449.1 hypothetical protein P376_3579 [Streptomyces sp. HCCB10043]
MGDGVVTSVDGDHVKVRFRLKADRARVAADERGEPVGAAAGLGPGGEGSVGWSLVFPGQ